MSLRSALALSCPPGSQHTEKDFMEGKEQQSSNAKKEIASVPHCQGGQCKHGAMERSMFNLPYSQIHFLYVVGVKPCGSHVLKPGNIKKKLQLLEARREGETKILFDMLGHLSFSRALN